MPALQVSIRLAGERVPRFRANTKTMNPLSSNYASSHSYSLISYPSSPSSRLSIILQAKSPNLNHDGTVDTNAVDVDDVSVVGKGTDASQEKLDIESCLSTVTATQSTSKTEDEEYKYCPPGGNDLKGINAPNGISDPVSSLMSKKAETTTHKRTNSIDKLLLRYKQSDNDESFLFDAFTGKLSLDDIYEIAVHESRPKKRPISMHSFVASMSAMASAVVLLPTFAPGIDAQFGLPQIFDYNHMVTNDLLYQCQFCAILQMLSSIMGVFRLPKNSPSVRTTGFVVAALIVVQIDLIILSSLNGTSIYLFDAFSTTGRIIMATMNTVLLRGSFDTLSLVIGDEERKGWDSVPGYENRISAIVTTLPFFFLTCIIGNASLPILADEAWFQTYAVPFFTEFPGVQTLGYIAINLSVGLGALLATLQFEKKISGTFASFLNQFITIFLIYDGVKFMYLINAFPDKFAHANYFTEYTPQLQSLFHTNETLLACTVLAVVKGFQNLNRSRKKRGEMEVVSKSAPALASSTSVSTSTSAAVSTPTSKGIVNSSTGNQSKK